MRTEKKFRRARTRLETFASAIPGRASCKPSGAIRSASSISTTKNTTRARAARIGATGLITLRTVPCFRPTVTTASLVALTTSSTSRAIASVPRKSNLPASRFRKSPKRRSFPPSTKSRAASQSYTFLSSRAFVPTKRGRIRSLSPSKPSSAKSPGRRTSMLFRTCPRPAPARSCVAFSPPFPIAWIPETSLLSRIPISSSRFVCSCRAVTLDRCKKVRKTSSALARNHKKLGTQDPHSASPLLSKPLDFAISKRRASDMGRKNDQGLSRRDFIKLSGSGAFALGAGSGPFFLFPERAAAEQKTMNILQWSHFVPAYDTWFDGTFCKQWGQKNNTNVIVDHINLVDLPAKAASEASAQKGHDLFMLLSPPAAYEKQTIDMAHVYQEVEKKHGKKIDLAHKSTYNPKTKR